MNWYEIDRNRYDFRLGDGSGKNQMLGFPPTNNQAERSLRPVVIMRKVIQGTRPDKGLENHTVLRSFLETAKRQDKKPHRFLFDLFTKSTAEAHAALYRNPLRKPEPEPILRC